MISEGTFELFAVVINPVSQNREQTPRLNVKIDFQAPDGASLKPITAKLSNPGIISREDLQNGITFEVEPYLNRRQFDTVRLELPGQKVFDHLLDSIPVEGSPVSFHVGAEFLTGFIGLMEAEVAYRVFDDVRNLSARSPATKFDVDNIANPLPRPTLVDAIASTIDLANLPWENGRSWRDTRVSVPVDGLAVGTVVRLNWRTTTPAGGSASGWLEQPVGAGGEDLLFDLPSDFNVTLQAGRLLVSYIAAGRTSSLAAAELVGALTERPLVFGDAHTQRAGLRYIILKGRPPLFPTSDSGGSYQRQASGGYLPYTYSSTSPGWQESIRTGWSLAQPTVPQRLL